MVSKKFDGLQGLLLYLHQKNECYLVDHTMALYELKFNLQPMADPPRDMLLDGELITNMNAGWFVVSDVLYCEDASAMAKPFTQRMAFAKTHFVKEEEMWNGVPQSSVRLVAKTLSPMKDLKKVWRPEGLGHCRRTGMRFLGRGGGLKGGAANAQTAHPATSSTAPAHQRRGSANAETTPAGAPAAAADRTQRPDATCEGKNG